MPGAFARVVNTVFGKLYREAVKGAFVKAGNESLNELHGLKLKVSKFLGQFRVGLFDH